MSLTPKRNEFCLLVVVFAFFIIMVSPVTAFAADVASSSDAEQEQTSFVAIDNSTAEEPITSNADTEVEEPIESDSVVEEVPAVDYSEQLDTVLFLLQYITGILMFFLVVVLCKYAYSFFNIFF